MLARVGSGTLTLCEPHQTLKIEVHQVRGEATRSARRASAATNWAFSALAQAPDNFILHVEEIGDEFVEPLRPDMGARFAVDELDIDAEAVLRCAGTLPSRT